ncbi:hypothetical protein AKJ09_04685 [Labilithrix luteola]|uniref:Uncharacterized protein n=1 Tax=Labilithrix luteola TaxID=1391654 RepID=A0A0K1PXA8_9BACT|nr:hypothetical protein AKJ09_04685 [Labilithrix luteola]
MDRLLGDEIVRAFAVIRDADSVASPRAGGRHPHAWSAITY